MMKNLLLILLIFTCAVSASYAVTGDISIEGRLDASGNMLALNFFGNGSNITDLGVLTGITILTTASTSPYTVPTGVTDIEVILIGGGGGGAGSTAPGNPGSIASGGGGGGACTIKRIETSGGITYSFVVGVGGAGSQAVVGTAGGQTQFSGTTYTANGGSGGINMTSGTTIATVLGGAGGTAGTTGDINIPGCSGGSGYRMALTLGFAGEGGASLYGSQSNTVIIPGAAAGTNNGIAGVLYGGGGSGGAGRRAGGTGNAAVTGGTGANGVIIIREYK